MATAVMGAGRLLRAPGFWDTNNGKKAVMALTGVALFGFIVGHLLGNLQVFLGRDKINAYAVLLHHTPALLWVARIGLLFVVGLHIIVTVQLAQRKRAARPVGYTHWKPTISTYASRTMYWSGPILLAYVIYHILHFTLGQVGYTAAHPYDPNDVYGNIVRGFQVWPVSLWYIFAMGLLCLHLYHGLWSAFQSLGAAHPTYTGLLRFGARSIALLIFLGYTSIPVAVLAGVLQA